MARDWRRLGFGIPHVQDVGATVYDRSPFDGRLEPVWFVGSDGSLWKLRIPFSEQCQQVPSPGDLTRVGVSPDESIWCCDSRGALWLMVSGSWSRVDVFGRKLIDVGVSADGVVWTITHDHAYWTISPGARPQFHGVLAVFNAVTGVSGPTDADPYGVAWGVLPTYGDGALCHCATINGWSPTNIQNVSDLSVGTDGKVWMTKSDGTIWTTTDGVTQLAIGGGGFTRIAAGISGEAWAVSNDGSAWGWLEPLSTPSPVSPPPVPPAPPPAQGAPPSISIGASGGGSSTVFRLTGTNFVPNAQVTVRGARIGDGQFHDFYWSTSSDNSGGVHLDIPLPCVPGIVISFSANDGRRDPGDLTNRLWSNTVQAVCPLG
jgi:hypothetical protein